MTARGYSGPREDAAATAAPSPPSPPSPPASRTRQPCMTRCIRPHYCSARPSAAYRTPPCNAHSGRHAGGRRVRLGQCADSVAPGARVRRQGSQCISRTWTRAAACPHVTPDVPFPGGQIDVRVATRARRCVPGSRKCTPVSLRMSWPLSATVALGGALVAHIAVS